ncbi:MAG: hypothetical protein HYX66_09205 [Ignavibacteria bacterium]|nr:hypothetical protein [Ignavibacteria bacterium]
MSLTKSVPTDIPFSARVVQAPSPDGTFVVAFHRNIDTLTVYRYDRYLARIDSQAVSIREAIGASPSINAPSAIQIIGGRLFALYYEGIISVNLDSLGKSDVKFIPTSEPFTQFFVNDDIIILGRFYDAVFGNSRCVLACYDLRGNFLYRTNLDIRSVVMTRLLPCNFASFSGNTCVVVDPLDMTILQLSCTRTGLDTIFYGQLKIDDRYKKPDVDSILQQTTGIEARLQIDRIMDFVTKEGSSIKQVVLFDDSTLYIARNKPSQLAKRSFEYTLTFYRISDDKSPQELLSFVSPGFESDYIVNHSRPFVFAYNNPPIRVDKKHFICIGMFSHDSMEGTNKSARDVFQSVFAAYQKGAPMTYSIFKYKVDL